MLAPAYVRILQAETRLLVVFGWAPAVDPPDQRRGADTWGAADRAARGRLPAAGVAGRLGRPLGSDGRRHLEEPTRRAIALSARLADPQPDPQWRVLLDPAGHPFCITTVEPPPELWATE